MSIPADDPLHPEVLEQIVQQIKQKYEAENQPLPSEAVLREMALQQQYHKASLT